MEYSVLGPLEAFRGATALRLSPKLRDVLAALLCRPNVTVTTECLTRALWAGAPPRSATKTVQAYVHHLRRALGAERIRSRAAGYVLVVLPGELDAEQFGGLVNQGRAAVRAGCREEGAALIGEALALWRGSAYEGQDHVQSVREESVRLNELRLTLVEERVDIELALGLHADLVGELRGLVGEHPFRERPRAQLMLALFRVGRTTEALEVFREGRTVLADEFGLDPGPILREMEQAILTGAAAFDPPYGQGRWDRRLLRGPTG